MIKRFLTALLALAVLMSSASITASAFTFSVGMEYKDIGTVVTNSTSTIVSGMEYSKTTYVDAKSQGQTLHAIEFNPQSTGYIPMMYQPKMSYPSTVVNTVSSAQSAGYDVLAAINGEFFSPNGYENEGTLTGRMVTNGRIVADSEDTNEVCLAIGSDGSFNLVKSEMAYHFYIEGKEVLNVEGGLPAIGSVNKRYVGDNWWSPLCYFDDATGGASYTNSSVPGVEVLFNKIDGTELMVEGVLQGEVVSVKENTYGTAIGKNQFVLYSQNGKPNYNALASLKPGQKVQIYAEELNADAKEIMKNAVTVSAATYPIVVDGKDNTANTPNASDIYLKRAQRTGIGVKADGTIVLLCTAGRGSSSNYDLGITLPEMAEMMIALGCKYAVNLDGGGSSTMWAGGGLKYSAGGRAVASTLMICRRNDATTSPAAKAELNNWITKATQATFAGEQQTRVNAAIAEAKTVYNDTSATTGSMTGDFLREKIDLQTAMGVVRSVAPKDYISLNAEDWSYDSALVSIKNDANGALVFNNLNGKWPTIAYGCNVNVAANDVFYYDFTANNQVSFEIKIDGAAVNLNSLIAPASEIDPGSGDIKASGRTYKGSIDVSKIKEGGFNLTSVTIWTIGSAGANSQVTIRDFSFGKASMSGDWDGNGAINMMDALNLYSMVALGEFPSDKTAEMDMNGDSQFNMMDCLLVYTLASGQA